MGAPFRLTDNQNCFACGPKNSGGLKLKFKMLANNEMESEFTPDPAYQGFQGLFHGGMMMLLLDEMMVNLVWKMGFHAVSADIRVRLKQAVRTGERILLRSRIRSHAKRKIMTEADAFVGKQLVARAEGICLRLKVHPNEGR